MSLGPEAIARIYAGFREGSDDAVESVRGWLRAVVHGGRWNIADAESVIQDCLLKLIRQARGDRVRDPSSFQKLCYTVAKNACVNVFHREKTRRAHEEPEEAAEHAAMHETDPADGLARRERAQLMIYIYQRLPEGCRKLWTAVYLDKRGQSDVASEFGITVNNLRVRAHRCIERARTILAEYRERNQTGERDG
ncbi:MAG: sigma-70 family RNA polymerase sigma factor [bacterium]|nr:sigma-70 family RNA polymerase sigma factor [bacterium]